MRDRVPASGGPGAQKRSARYPRLRQGLRGSHVGYCALALPSSAAKRYHLTASASSFGTPSPVAYMMRRLNCASAYPDSAFFRISSSGYARATDSKTANAQSRRVARLMDQPCAGIRPRPRRFGTGDVVHMTGMPSSRRLMAAGGTFPVWEGGGRGGSSNSPQAAMIFPKTLSALSVRRWRKPKHLPAHRPLRRHPRRQSAG